MFDISFTDKMFYYGKPDVCRIIAKWDCYTSEKISLKKLIFNAAVDSNIYFIFFDKSLLPVEEAVQKLVGICYSQSIKIDCRVPIVQNMTRVDYSDNKIRIVQQQPSTNIPDLLNGGLFNDENKYIFKPNVAESIWISPLWFELYTNENGLTLRMCYNDEETLNTYAALCNEKVKFIDFNNIEFDI